MLKRIEVNPDSCSVAVSSQASQPKSTLAARYRALLEVLGVNETDNVSEIAETDAVTYADISQELASVFATKFHMEATGARKVAGDVLGHSGHGLQLRKVDAKGQLIVHIREAADRAIKALGVIKTSTSCGKQVMKEIRTALGLPEPQPKAVAKAQKDAIETAQIVAIMNSEV
jgi:hypothetical protein